MTQPVRLISVTDLRALLAGENKPLLIDVREVHEFEAGHVEEAVNIPLSEFADRIGEIPAGSEPLFICRSGGRSYNACLFALQSGIANPTNVEGGMLAWDAGEQEFQ